MKLKNVKFGTKVMVKNNQNNEHTVFNGVNLGKEGFIVRFYEDDVVVCFPTNDECFLLSYDLDYGHYSNLKLVKEVNISE